MASRYSDWEDEYLDDNSETFQKISHKTKSAKRKKDTIRENRKRKRQEQEQFQQDLED